MPLMPFNFNIKSIKDGNVLFINGEHIVKVDYVIGGDSVTVTLSDGNKEHFDGSLAKEIIARFEAVKFKS